MLVLLLKIHGELRWLVALVGIVALVRYAVAVLGSAEFKSLDRRLMSVLRILLSLNLVLGLVLLFALGGGFPHNRLEHALTMFLAVAAAHLPLMLKGAQDSASQFKKHLVAVVLTLALVAVGVFRLRGAWIWS